MKARRRSHAFGAVFLGVALAGCASTVAQIFPVGEPITAERCEKLDLHSMGYKDGAEGQRPGPRFDFWDADCRKFGIKIDRAAYDKGFAEGQKFYCSCEKGFDSGVRGKFTEFSGQYYTCKKVDHAEFMKGHAEGSKLKADPAYVEIKGVNKKFHEDVIKSKAVESCRAIAQGNTPSMPPVSEKSTSP